MTPQYVPFCGVQLTTSGHSAEPGTAPHKRSVPPPPHVNVPLQPPQSRGPPQPSPTVLQSLLPGCSQTVGVQNPESSGAPQTCAVPRPPHVKPSALQSPHSSSPLQPTIVPQYWPPSGMHVSAHTGFGGRVPPCGRDGAPPSGFWNGLPPLPPVLAMPPRPPVPGFGVDGGFRSPLSSPEQAAKAMNSRLAARSAANEPARAARAVRRWVKGSSFMETRSAGWSESNRSHESLLPRRAFGSARNAR